MGHLWLLQEGFETGTIAEDKRDKAVSDFCQMSEQAFKERDRYYACQEFFEHAFSYGGFCNGFVYRDWESFSTELSLSGISQLTYQSIANTFFQYPEVKTVEACEFDGFSGLKGNAGLEQDSVTVSPYIHNIDKWEQWHRDWLTAHPEEISWDSGNDFLPNAKYVEEVLLEEIHKYEKSDYLQHPDYCDKGNTIALVFHYEVMANKGDFLIDYTQEIGAKICLGNYYCYEQLLSVAETRRKHSLRRIYSIYNTVLNRKQYISLDMKHGMFEFHNEKGEHLGEFHFDGSYNSGAEIDHSLTCIP